MCFGKAFFFSSEDGFFQVREQEFDANVWIRSLNALTWVEILRQVLVASGFGPKQHLLNQEFFNKVLRVAQHSKVLSRSMLLLSANLLVIQVSLVVKFFWYLLPGEKPNG
jgi:hypothetical protein